jgi:hypothetical protein
MSQQNTPKSNPSSLKKAIFGFILICIGLCGFCVIGPSIDRKICLPAVADKIGIEPNYEAIYSYIHKLRRPKMTRDEVLVALEGIGPVSVLFSTKFPDGTIIDDVAINMCWYWLNDIRVLIYYPSGTQQITDIVITNEASQ